MNYPYSHSPLTFIPRISSHLFHQQDTKKANKPSTSTVSEALTLSTKKSAKKVAAAVACRPDLTSAAKLKLARMSKYISAKKGYSKKAVKSTRRSKK